MVISRRRFIGYGGIAIASLAVGNLWGCSSEDSTSQKSNEATVSKNEDTYMTESEERTVATMGNASKTAVVYFSCTGNTQSVAEKIAQATGATLIEIEPQVPYTPADLDYNSDCRANTEQQDAASRPAMANPIPNVSQYDVVYLGYPIWWGKAPRIILSFEDASDLSGKTIIPFCTSGSSPISGSLNELEQNAVDAKWIEGRRFPANVSEQEIDQWVKSI